MGNLHTFKQLSARGDAAEDPEGHSNMFSSGTLSSLRSIPSTAKHLDRRLYLLGLLCVDAIMLGLAFWLAYWLRFRVGITLTDETGGSILHYSRLVAILIPLWLALFAVMRLYDYRSLLGGTEEYARAFNAITIGMMIVIVVSFVVDANIVARAWLIMAWGLATATVIGGRFAMRRVAYALRSSGHFVNPVIIVGANQEAIALAEQFAGGDQASVNVLGFVVPNVADAPDPDQAAHPSAPILGGLEDLPALVSRHGVQEVIVATTSLRREQLLGLFQALAPMRNVEVCLSSGLYEVMTTGMQIRTLGAVPLMTLNNLRLSAAEKIMKSALDYTLILLASIFLIPLFAIMALAIKLDSPGPVFHRRRVLGVGGKVLDAFKFRTMFVDGDEILAENPQLAAELAANHKLQDDPRITRVGAWLRRTSLDELPQLINVLLGQMSLVGPRMISPAEAAEYGDRKHNLLTVKPGMTGLWQVSGRSDLTYEERVQLDMHYIRNYSIWRDLQILFLQTPPAVLNRRGAY